MAPRTKGQVSKKLSATEPFHSGMHIAEFVHDENGVTFVCHVDGVLCEETLLGAVELVEQHDYLARHLASSAS